MGAVSLLLSLPFRRRIDRLNLTLELSMDPVAVTTSFKPQFSLHPTAAGKGRAVTDLTEIVWSVSDANVATVAETKDDHSAAELRPVAAGTVVLTVSAKRADGTVLTDVATVTFSEPAIDSLGLTHDGDTPA